MVAGIVYPRVMADNSNPSVMIDLDFARYLGTQVLEQGTTVYSRADFRSEIDNMRAQGWTLVNITRVIH